MISIAKKLKPSKRNELEITDINNIFLKKKQLKLVKLDQNISWIDTGTYDSMLYASNFFQNLEKNTSNKYACVEGIVYELGYINKNLLEGLIKSMSKSSYGKYLKRKYLKK